MRGYRCIYDIVEEQMIECARKGYIAYFDTGNKIIDSEGEHLCCPECGECYMDERLEGEA